MKMKKGRPERGGTSRRTSLLILDPILNIPVAGSGNETGLIEFHDDSTQQVGIVSKASEKRVEVFVIMLKSTV